MLLSTLDYRCNGNLLTVVTVGSVASIYGMALCCLWWFESQWVTYTVIINHAVSIKVLLLTAWLIMTVYVTHCGLNSRLHYHLFLASFVHWGFRL